MTMMIFGSIRTDHALFIHGRTFTPSPLERRRPGSLGLACHREAGMHAGRIGLRCQWLCRRPHRDVPATYVLLEPCIMVRQRCRLSYTPRILTGRPNLQDLKTPGRRHLLQSKPEPKPKTSTLLMSHCRLLGSRCLTCWSRASHVMLQADGTLWWMNSYSLVQIACSLCRRLPLPYIAKGPWPSGPARPWPSRPARLRPSRPARQCPIRGPKSG
jgi:hypothetical protein